MEHEKGPTATTMDGILEFAARGLGQAFLQSNLARLWVGDRSRERVESANALGDLVHQDDGTPVLRHRGALIGTPSDDLWLSRTVRESPPGSAYVVFGLGMGHTVRQLRAMTDAPILIYEPEPGIARRALEAGPTDLGNIPLVCAPTDLPQLWPAFGGNTENVTLITTPGYSTLYEREDRDLREALTQLVQRSSVNTATHRLRAREWISDVLENIELLGSAPCVLGLAEKYKNVPAFIVGAGPSLGKNGELLAEAKKKGLVIAVNSSALPLARLGVTPHIVTCMESIDLSALLGRVPYLDEVARVFSLAAHPKTLRTGKGPLLPVYEGLPLLAPLAQLGRALGLPVCGSVSTLAFSLAQRLGCSPIVFVGQDLAFTGGEAYAPGSAYEGSRVRVSADGRSIEHERSATLKATNDRMPEREPLREVTAWGGRGQVWSTIGFSAIRSWLELAREILGRDTPGQRFVNATEGGARIAGFEERTLAEVLSELPACSITVDEIARTAAEARPPLSTEALRGWTQGQLDRARAVRHSARRVRRLTRVAKAAIDRDDPRRITLSFGRLSDAERALRSAVSAAPFVDAYSWLDVDSLAREPSAASDSLAAASRAIDTEGLIARAIETCTRELEDKLAETLRSFGAPAP